MTRILVLDGGMGATLEELGHDCSGPMWGSELVTSNPGVVTAAHKGFVDAGADIIETATYQMTVDSLARAGHSSDTHAAVLGKAVELAADVSAASTSAVALSLGAYGATLPGAQEYRGFYAPPYGPKAYVEDGDNVNYSTGAEFDGHVGALAAWHLDRLRVYAAEKSWNSIKYLAFETVPLISEYKGIRLAVEQLFAELPADAARPLFWIASAFPNGHPQQDGKGGRVTVDVLVDALLEGPGARPHGIGINCTAPALLDTLVPEFSAAVAKHNGPAPWLVIYPDGGDILDLVNRKWIRQPGQSPPEWAAKLAGIARTAEADGDGKTWGGVIVGGCCGAMFSKITALRQALL